MDDSILILITVVAMFLSLFLILIPAIPVSALEWGIVMVFGALTGFERFTPIAAIIATIFMALGSTSGFWLPFIGMKGRNISWLGLLAFFIGMIVGSFLIPIPFIGTVAGGVVGVMLVEFARIRDFTSALRSGKTALKIIFYTMMVEFIFAILIFGTFMLSLASTAPFR